MNEPLFRKHLAQRQIVGVIGSQEDLQEALRDTSVADGYEFRVDLCEGPEVEKAMQTLWQAGKFTVLTVRDNAEGSPVLLSMKARIRRFKRYMKYATFVDIEAAFADQLTEVIDLARKNRVGVIISCHYLERTPSLDQILRASEICETRSGNVFKVAAAAHSPSEFFCIVGASLTLFDTTRRKAPVALMCVGKEYGKASRLVFAQAGSIFVYGSLAQAVVPGQWSVAELRKELSQLP